MSFIEKILRIQKLHDTNWHLKNLLDMEYRQI